MTPLLDLARLIILARKDIAPDDEFAQWCMEGASIVVADRAGRWDWLGVTDETGAAPAPLAAPPARAVMIAEQLAKRSYLNPDSIVAEGAIGPIGGDRYVEELSRFMELTEEEASYLDGVAGGSGGGNLPAGVGVMGVIRTENRPGLGWSAGTVHLPDVDPRADSWPMYPAEPI